MVRLRNIWARCRPGLRAALLEFGGDHTVAWLSAPAITSDRLLDVGEERLARVKPQAWTYKCCPSRPQ